MKEKSIILTMTLCLIISFCLGCQEGNMADNSSKSKAPSNGQRALDNSFSVSENTARRIGISDGEIVILDQTSPGLFHGHVRTWNNLRQEMKNILIDANLVTSRGKIK